MIPHLPHFDDATGRGDHMYQLGHSGPPTPIPSQWMPDSQAFMDRYVSRVRQNSSAEDDFNKAYSQYASLVRHVNAATPTMHETAQPYSSPSFGDVTKLASTGLNFGKQGEIFGPSMPLGGNNVNWGQSGELPLGPALDPGAHGFDPNLLINLPGAGASGVGLGSAGAEIGGAELMADLGPELMMLFAV